MSRLFPDQLRVSIAPDQVIVERHALRASLKGIGTRLLDRRILRPFGTAGRNKHEAALQVMASALATIDDRQQCRVCVVLANSLVRYLLVPHSSRLGPEDAAAVVRHCFQEVYGDAAERWELRASPASDLPLQLASGIERGLIDDLRSAMAALGMRLESVQPRLMAVCNEHRRILDRRPAWLILIEPGMLCLGLLDQGSLVRLRSLRIDAQWAADLPALLDRETCLADLDETPADAFLWMGLGVVPSVPPSLPLRMHVLQDQWPIDQADAAGHLAVVRS